MRKPTLAYVFTDSDREKSHAPDAAAKRRAARASRIELRKEDVLLLYRRGLIPLAIADKLGLRPRTVARYLRELETDGKIDPVPSYLTKS